MSSSRTRGTHKGLGERMEDQGNEEGFCHQPVTCFAHCTPAVCLVMNALIAIAL